jgi:hypothetical protein
VAVLSRYNKDSYRKTRARRTWWLREFSDHPAGLNGMGGDRRRWEHHHSVHLTKNQPLATTELS